MKKLLMIAVLLPALVMAMVACNSDIKPKRPITDKYGVVFLENGKLDTVNTEITTEQLRKALVDSEWEFSYSFFYDDYKIGRRGEDQYFSRFRYHYSADGTVVATDLVDGKTYNYTYTLTARTVTLKSATASFSFGVIAMDKRHMVCDESLAGQTAGDYDPATLTRRMVFLSRK